VKKANSPNSARNNHNAKKRVLRGRMVKSRNSSDCNCNGSNKKQKPNDRGHSIERITSVNSLNNGEHKIPSTTRANALINGFPNETLASRNETVKTPSSQPFHRSFINFVKNLFKDIF
jgi:hypothetical protein